MDENVRIRDDFDILPIKDLYESPLNPRKTYSEKGMKELAESIQSKGILMPLVVRPNNGRFEIAAGHRRYRAALRLELTEIPALIREMSDPDFLELITIENLQREDIHPLDEAQGYRTLIEKTGLEVQAVAAKVGKSPSYVYQRLKLADLIPEAQKAFSEEKITAGHAILIARLQPKDQSAVLKECLDGNGWSHETMSVRDTADYIEKEIHLDLNSASFSKKDATLVPEAGGCTTCAKRTGFQPDLFADIKKKDTCTDRICFHRKVEAHTALWLKKKSEDTDVPPLKLSGDSDYRKKKLPDDPNEPIPANFYCEISDKKKGSCQHTREGIITQGRNQGKILTVCVDPECKKHHAGRYPYSSSPEDNRYKAQQKAEQAKKQLNFKIREAILDATLSAWPGKFSKQDLLILATEFYKPVWHEHQKKILSRHDVKPKKLQYASDTESPMLAWLKERTEKELQVFLVEVALFRNLERHWTDKRKEDPLLETAKHYGVNPKKIEDQLRAEIKGKKLKAKVKKSSQTSAKKKKQTK